MDATVVLGRQGRIVVPVEIRSALGLEPGDRLAIRVEGRQMLLSRPEDAAAALRGLVANVPPTRSLVEELLADRRRAAARGE